MFRPVAARTGDRVQVGGGSTLSTQGKASWCKSQGVGTYLKTAKDVRYKGRTARLRTEAHWDEKALGAAWDVAKGDRVTVWRTKKTYEMYEKHRYIKNPSGGKRGCHDTANWYEANVMDHIQTSAVRLRKNGTHSHAVRVCVTTNRGKAKCQPKWFVDGKR
ncbi:hypothetical protein [Streptomyces alboflavus]|uniref:hypothetical protein n=1 Tax=Streptomyces alboflavus TaxID=67267 RepID=UPI0012FE8028|nr:hypothetical protein [Streptomyces alboflavus]